MARYGEMLVDDGLVYRSIVHVRCVNMNIDRCPKGTIRAYQRHWSFPYLFLHSRRIFRVIGPRYLRMRMPRSMHAKMLHTDPGSEVDMASIDA